VGLRPTPQLGASPQDPSPAGRAPQERRLVFFIFLAFNFIFFTFQSQVLPPSHSIGVFFELFSLGYKLTSVILDYQFDLSEGQFFIYNFFVQIFSSY